MLATDNEKLLTIKNELEQELSKLSNKLKIIKKKLDSDANEAAQRIKLLEA